MKALNNKQFIYEKKKLENNAEVLALKLEELDLSEEIIIEFIDPDY